MQVPGLSLAVLLLAGPLFAASDDLEGSLEKLKEAESKKDAVEVKKLAAETCALARQISSAPAPEDKDAKEAWTNRVAYAREIEVRTEYALYATAVQSPPPVMVDLLSALEQQNPKSKYLDEGYGHYFIALTKTGAVAKVPAIAEKAIANFPENEDLLLVLADAAMSQKQTDRALNYAERLGTVLTRHPKPETMAAADWERKRNASLGRARWISGLMHCEKQQHFEADKDLRAALPLIRGNDAMAAAALFNLGLVNYQLGTAMRNKAQVLEAAKFSEQAAAIKGPYSQQAWRNSIAMRAEAMKIR